jgi:hypothetical protein
MVERVPLNRIGGGFLVVKARMPRLRLSDTGEFAKQQQADRGLSPLAPIGG